MLKYTLKRLVNAVVVLFIITTATWFLMQLLPGSPIQNAEKLTPEQEAQVEEQVQPGQIPAWSVRPVHDGNRGAISVTHTNTEGSP